MRIRTIETVLGFIMMVVFVFLFGCRQNRHTDSLPSPSPTSSGRTQLTVEQLKDGGAWDIVDNRFFLPIGDNISDGLVFSGTIDIPETPMKTSHSYTTFEASGFTLFPSISFTFISHNGYLIPLERGRILHRQQGRSAWNIILGAGRTWTEPGDQGYSRASFPFTLTTNGIGQARNGVATFLYNESQISRVYFQVTQETAPIDAYEHSDFQLLVEAQYTSRVFSQQEEIIAAFQQELASRIDILPWNQLENAESLKELYNTGMRSEEISAAALMLDGVIYLQPLETRSGNYPYPGEMRHGVFSVTKSLCGGLAIFYLAERYGEEIFDALITDYVPALSQHQSWQGVTFRHTINMVSGATGPESTLDLGRFIQAQSSAQKLAAIASLPDNPARPGEIFQYTSTDSFVLSCALNGYVKAKEGPGADYWSMVEENVLKRIGIFHLPVMRTIEANGLPGVPILGWGSYPTVDEAMKIARLINNDGIHEGQPLLNVNKVREALYKNHWPAFSPGYSHSFWSQLVPGVNCDFRVACMLGHGGNYIVLLPSQIVAIRFSDANYYNIDYIVEVAERLRRSCE